MINHRSGWSAWRSIAVLLALLYCGGTLAAPKVYYVHTDHLGTPQALSDKNQTVVWRAHYEPFGTATVDEDPDGDGTRVVMPIRFPGQYFDSESGLHYNYFRDYNPGTGRYIQSDPIGLRGGINTYAYALGNPVMFIDPLGLWAAGVSVGVSTINPWTSGGGGAYGVNFEYTSDAGWHVYTYGTPDDPCHKSEGFEVGGSVTANFALGNGSWEGLFDQVDANVGPVSFGQFHAPRGTFQNGYYGFQGGLGVGAPYGVGTTQTNYTIKR